MAEEFAIRGDLEALRSELKGDINHVPLEVADLRTDMVERFGRVQAEFGTVRADLADVRKDLAVLQVDIRKDLEAFGQQQDQMRQEMRDMRQEMNQWRLSTTRQMWMMMIVVTGAVLVGILKLVFFPTP